MDGDRASAARKLPQTAANFFVGTRSRVPRLTLAQSSHVIPIPPSPSPGLKPSSHVVRSRMRASPFPTSPTSSKASNSPRNVSAKGTKVANAVHLFSGLTGEASSSPLDPPNAVQTPLHLQVEASDSTPSPSVSASTEAIVPSLNSISSAPVDGLSLKESEPLLFELESLPRTPSTRLSASAEHPSTQQELRTTCALSPDLFQNPSIAADRQVAVSPATESRPAAGHPAASAETSMDSDPFALSSALSTSQDILQHHVDAELESPPLPPNSIVPPSHRERLSLLDMPPIQLAASPKDCIQALKLPHRASAHINKAEAETAEGTFDFSPTIFDAGSSLPRFNEAIFSQKSPLRSASDRQSPQEILSNLSPEEVVETAALVPKSAFSDATAPSSSSAHRRAPVDHLNADLSQRQNDTTSRNLPSWDSPSSGSSKHAAPPLAGHVSGHLSSLTDARSISHSSPDRPRDTSQVTAPASPPHPHGSVDQHGQLSRGGIGRSIQGHSIREGHSKSSKSGSSGEVTGELKQKDDSNRKEVPSSASRGLPSLSTAESTQYHASSRPEDGKDTKTPPIAHENQHSAKSVRVDETLPEHRFVVDSNPAHGDLVQHGRSEHLTSLLDPQSAADDEVLLDLIDMAAMPVAITEDANLKDSLLERTASWIKSTFSERESVTTEPFISDQDKFHPRSVVNDNQTDALVGTASSVSRLKQCSPTPEPPRPHNLDDSPSRSRAKADQIDLRKQRHVPVADAGTATGRTLATIRSYENRSDEHNPINDRKAEPVRRKIVRSYSQRDGQDQHTIKGTKRIPGRLKIPQRQPESSAAPRRGSLELLSVRRAQLSSAKEKADSPQLETRRSFEGFGSARAGNFNDVLRSWSRSKDAEPSQPTPLGLAKHRVSGMVKDWDDGAASSEDDEVAAVSTCRRMTLRRMSDFSVFSTPRRDRRPLPGKLLRADGDSVAVQPAPGVSRPLMRLRPGPEPAQANIVRAPGGRLVHQRQSLEKQPEHALSPPRRRLRNLASHLTDSKSSGIAGLGLRPTVARRAQAPLIEPRLSLSEVDADEPLEILRAQDRIRPSSVSHQVQAAPTIRMQSINSTAQHAQASAQSTPLRRFKLHGDSAADTARRREVSVTTSPLSVVSEIWTPNASNPTGSVLTEATSVTTNSGLRPLLTARARSRSQTVAAPNGARDVDGMRLDISAESPTSSHLQPRSQSGRYAFQGENRSRSPEAHARASQTHPGLREQRVQSGAPAHRTGVPQHSRLDTLYSHLDIEREATAPDRGSSVRLPSFEISFEVTEPKVAPHVQEGTLMEFGVRIHFRPSATEQSSGSWELKPPAPFARSGASSHRSSASIHPLQYEYNRLSQHDMSRVQREAQEHLSRTLASPDQRQRRLHLRESFLLSPFSDHRELDRSSSRTDSGLLTSSKRPVHREIRLTRERELSPSAAPSSVVSVSRGASMVRTSSANLASPLPYIKRAPPRTATLSSVITQS